MKLQPTERVSGKPRRRALTLIELVVVVAILVALSGLVVPLVQGLGFQTNAAINATVIDDVNRSVETFAIRLNAHPDGWDSLLNTSGGTIYAGLHPSLGAANPVLIVPTSLTALQLESLNSAGIYNVRDSDEAIATTSMSPSANNLTPRKLVASGKVAVLKKVGAPDSATVLDTDFKVNRFSDGDLSNEYIVFGLGSGTTIQGAVMMQIPLMQCADPNNYYARVCCVYMVPSNAATTSFPARYVGCFMPDGTTARRNMENYNNAFTDR
ncbi:MAG: prepilin-type N-terminal cleavage/methylation domain-containing protein [Planctomycetia bacterium]|nr:prepilin-type N-terminal cleavage/methylation domain-containing protein [Planctomycetia bacterium]